ncbi:MAG: 4-(cytidine 5'-diphospho)-2-C-methyl-D-erythritol kinase [Candidatus Margulisbacteria bacterium]|nr:4-(cytidine 5'-diphospho)-2-C-methyl-D-erythritol kinase [Candidatus Margulisiibacteriota bacterium]
MLRLKAYAKINLSLRILGRRPDGYHELDSIMQSVSLADQVTLTEIPSGIQLATTNLKLPNDQRNLAYKAAALFWESQNSKVKSKNNGIKIFIEKNIPLAAGLAGGSADAAAVLFGLNEMAPPSLRVTRSSLLGLGAQLGSDVPFCLTGGNCQVTGRGEHVKRTMFHGKRYFVLVTPDVEVPTKWAYEAFDQMTNDELRMINEGRRNDLEFVVIRRYPVIQQIKEKLVELGCSFSQMSGSGPTVFGIVPDQAAGERIAAVMKQEYARSFAVESVETGLDTLS